MFEVLCTQRLGSGSYFQNHNEKKLPSAGADSHSHSVTLHTVNCQAGAALISALSSSGCFTFKHFADFKNSVGGGSEA